MKLYFYGGARTVTGANYLLEIEQPKEKTKLKILVDCGLTQGAQHVEERNYDKFPYQPSEVSFLLVTHSHIDHIGRIPKLYHDGFNGQILLTEPTKDFSAVMLEDSQGLLADEAERKGKKPLYSMIDVNQSLKLMKGVGYDKKIKLAKDVYCCFRDAGHVLGSAIIEIYAEGKKIVFSGDLGNPPVPFLRPTEFIKKADYLLIESTYGDRLHEVTAKRKDLLENAIEDTVARGGNLIIPSFALERTQELLYELNGLVENHRIPKVPIFIDSPLAIKTTFIYQKHPKYYNKEAKRLVKEGDNLFDFPGLVLTRTTAESKRINDVAAPKIIVAGSGMSTGGRILHHELRYLSDPKSMILFIGYQVAGTLGRRILDGAKEVKIFRERVSVKAEVRSIPGYSAHADQKMLVNWVEKMRKSLKRVFVVQGEEKPARVLAQVIKDNLGIEATVPKFGDVVELN